MSYRFWSKPWLNLTVLTVLAGILYCSWPLGYWLNPIVNRGLASDLEATGQPYNWVFISLDIISGLMICAAMVWLLRALGKNKSWWLTAGLFGFGAFGLLTAIDALLPLDCVSTVQQCGSVWHDPFFIIHGIASIGSIAGLTISIISSWWLLARDRRTDEWLRTLLHGTMLVWFGFGFLTFVLILLNRSSGNAQHVFITICSVWTAAVPYLIWRALTRRPLVVRE